tara:strand:- start:254 stop:412 length:159 start_codon:yes stop_codon:yes gene_type:complete
MKTKENRELQFMKSGPYKGTTRNWNTSKRARPRVIKSTTKPKLRIVQGFGDG